MRAPGSPEFLRLKSLMRDLNLHTVCEDARCPNIGECWNHGTATFMILGDVCTRACAYCAVAHGRPGAVDTGEPARVADAIPDPQPELRRRHLGRSRRSAGRRRVDLRRKRSAKRARACRNAGSKCSFLIFRATSRRFTPCSTPGPTCSITTPKPFRGCTRWRDRADGTRARWSCSTVAPLRPRHSHEDRRDGGPRRGARRARGHVQGSSRCRLRNSDHRPVSASVGSARAHDPLLPSRRVPRAQTDRARSGLRPRRIRTARAQLVPRTRDRRRVRTRRTAAVARY